MNRPKPKYYFDCGYCEHEETPNNECLSLHYSPEEAAKFKFRLLRPEFREVVQISSDCWYYWDGEAWAKMDAEQQEAMS